MSTATTENTVQEPASGYSATGAIIIVDDSISMLEYLHEFLRAHDFTNVYRFSSAQKALIAFGEGLWPTVVISDYEMPGMNGVEFLEAVMAMHPSTPCYLMSVQASIEQTLLPAERVFTKTRDGFSECVLAAVAAAVGESDRG